MVIKHRNKFYLVETNEQACGFKLLQVTQDKIREPRMQIRHFF